MNKEELLQERKALYFGFTDKELIDSLHKSLDYVFDDSIDVNQRLGYAMGTIAFMITELEGR